MGQRKPSTVLSFMWTKIASSHLSCSSLIYLRDNGGCFNVTSGSSHCGYLFGITWQQIDRMKCGLSKHLSICQVQLHTASGPTWFWCDLPREVAYVNHFQRQNKELPICPVRKEPPCFFPKPLFYCKSPKLWNKKIQSLLQMCVCLILELF
jgi:hypothetical protein